MRQWPQARAACGSGRCWHSCAANSHRPPAAGLATGAEQLLLPLQQRSAADAAAGCRGPPAAGGSGRGWHVGSNHKPLPAASCLTGNRRSAAAGAFRCCCCILLQPAAAACRQPLSWQRSTAAAEDAEVHCCNGGREIGGKGITDRRRLVVSCDILKACLLRRDLRHRFRFVLTRSCEPKTFSPSSMVLMHRVKNLILRLARVCGTQAVPL